MYRYLLIIIFVVITSKSNSEIKSYHQDDYFYIGKMVSYNNNFTLYFKTREKAILSKGEDLNYINEINTYMTINLKMIIQLFLTSRFQKK